MMEVSSTELVEPVIRLPKLSWESTVPRRLVHRAAVAGVLITDHVRLGEDSFLLAAQWPRGHPMVVARPDRFDPLLVAETIRQCGILLAHEGYGVPMGQPFLMRRMGFDCDLQGLHPRTTPLDLVVAVKVSEVMRRPRTIGGMRIDVDIRHEEVRIAGGQGWLRVLHPRTYDRVRWPGGRRPSSAPTTHVTPAVPGTVGKLISADVVLTAPEAPGVHRLRVPLDHPVFFDHPLDHVPGMLAFEAMRQAARALTGQPGADLIAADAQFPAFLDLDRECFVIAERSREVPSAEVVAVRLVQDGTVGVGGSVRLDRDPRPAA